MYDCTYHNCTNPAVDGTLLCVRHHRQEAELGQKLMAAGGVVILAVTVVVLAVAIVAGCIITDIIYS